MVSLILIIIIGYQINQTINYQVPDNLITYHFEVQLNESISSITNHLSEQGFIINENLLQWYLKTKPEITKNIQAGEYRIQVGDKPLDVLSKLEGGTYEETITFIEGWRREQYAKLLAQRKDINYALEFLDKTSTKEGYLFPDTYFIDDNTTVDQLIDKIEENFNQKVGELLVDQLSYLTKQEAMILASLIEREVIDPTEKRIVAGILIKRLTNGWNLDIDASVQYAIANYSLDGTTITNAITDQTFKWWPKIITEEELSINSSFNTRKNLGLPPAPICNPGLTSIQALTDPTMTDYWYYFTDQDGITHFSTSLEEHNYQISIFGLSE